MENLTKQGGLDSFHQKLSQNKTSHQKTLLTIALVVTLLGFGVSFYFTNKIETFFWEARTSFVGDVAHELAVHYLQKDDMSNWQNNDANGRLLQFTKEAREFIPNAEAIKIYSTNGILAWTNLQDVKPGHQKPEDDGELAQVRANKRMILPAGEETKQELGKQNLLEVWSLIEDPRGEDLGFIEIYFNTSDINVFITKIKYSIWFVVITMLAIVLFMISLEFRKQDDLIVRQAYELSNIIDQSPIGIYTLSKAGVIETCNQAMMEISGNTGTCEAMGGNVLESDEYVKNGLSELLRAGINGTPFETEIEFESLKNLHQKTFRRYHGVPIKNGNGEVLYLLVMVEDITEHKKKEQGLDVQAKELETAVDARTKALEEKIAELERFERLTVDREIRMTELKTQIEKMRIKLEGLGVNADTI